MASLDFVFLPRVKSERRRVRSRRHNLRPLVFARGWPVHRVQPQPALRLEDLPPVRVRADRGHFLAGGADSLWPDADTSQACSCVPAGLRDSVSTSNLTTGTSAPAQMRLGAGSVAGVGAGKLTGPDSPSRVRMLRAGHLAGALVQTATRHTVRTLA